MSLEELPSELLYQIFDELSTADAARLCATNSQFQEWCQRYNILERLATLEIRERAPYRVWYGSDLDFLKLLEHGQTTVYTLKRKVERVDGEPIFELFAHMPNPDTFGPMGITLPGTLLQDGTYWLFGSPDAWSNMRWYVFKTQEELDRRLSWYYGQDYGYDEEVAQFIQRFKRQGGVNQPLDQAYQVEEIGDPDGDVIRVFLLPFTIGV